MNVSTPTPSVREIPAVSGAAPDAATRRLLWECRRGMKELDLLLERFARVALPVASEEERATFAQLLALPDSHLAAYLLGGTPPAEPRLARLVDSIQALCRSRGGSGVFCR